MEKINLIKKKSAYRKNQLSTVCFELRVILIVMNNIQQVFLHRIKFKENIGNVVYPA
jgi:hypothetical protein